MANHSHYGRTALELLPTPVQYSTLVEAAAEEKVPRELFGEPGSAVTFSVTNVLALASIRRAVE